MKTTTTPRVWVGCLECYNEESTVVGDWYDAEDADQLTSEQVHGHPSAHEELWCFDMEGFGGLLTEEASPEDAARIARMIEGIGDEEKVAAFAAWCQDQRRTAPDQLDHSVWGEFEEQFQGVFDDEGDFAHGLAEDICNLHDEWPYSYIDWKRAARDLFWSGDYTSAELPNGRVAVWRSC